MTPKKTIIKDQKYIIQLIQYSDGSSLLKRNNKSFAVVELLGLLEIVRADLLNEYGTGIKALLEKHKTEIKRISNGVPTFPKP